MSFYTKISLICQYVQINLTVKLNWFVSQAFKNSFQLEDFLGVDGTN